ncbi:MAG: hypothetical protein M0029_06865 [Actinomycetota bacterium]|jgi:hypothetical protein|nr:hypothetical protein [Actinomycetota bacterium]
MNPQARGRLAKVVAVFGRGRRSSPQRDRVPLDRVTLHVAVADDSVEQVDTLERRRVHVFADRACTTELLPDDGGQSVPGFFLCRVAGVARHLEAVRSNEFGILCPVTIRHEAGGPHRATALAVVSATGARAGYLPAPVAASFAEPFDTELAGAGFVAGEWTRDGARVGLVVAGTIGRSLDVDVGA